MILRQEEGHPPDPVARRIFWSTFWALSGLEAATIAVWTRDRFEDNRAGFVAAVILVPTLLLGHFNVVPAALAAWWVRRRRAAAA